MTKSVKICIAVIVVLFICAVTASFILLTGSFMLFKKSDSQYVLIVQNNEVIYKLNLKTAKNQTMKIEDKNGGYNIIEISDGRIRISDADCPDKTCVNTGFLSGDVPIVCLPHKLVIKYSYENEN
ncbi:MAG: NusG domain II-containing protein [Ruminococcus sp.]|nr:NusG domain II-containing protein [Ruminococcus sp.]